MIARPRRVRIDLAYDGTDYAGWQVQPADRTVQGTLEGVLTRLEGDRPVRVRGAGRTDAGVHARGQVADALLAARLDDAELAHALRAMLPADVRPTAVRTVPDAFHSRHDARSKTYRYSLDRTREGDPFRARYALHLPDALDEAALVDALGRLPGERDWSGFVAAGSDSSNHVRRLTEARFEPQGACGAGFVFTGNGFLKYMVRNLVGTLLEIGRGRAEPSLVERILDTGERGLGGPTAPPHGLCLEQVTYGASRDSDR